MKIEYFESREQWLACREGKITGTRLKDVANKATVAKEDLVKELEKAKVEFKKTSKKEELEALLPKEAIFTMKMKASLAEDKKIAYYELIAEGLKIREEDFDGYVPDETPMDRGTRLQSYAIDRYQRETGKKVDSTLVLWQREDCPEIAISPDGTIIGSELTEAIEIKCLSSARHVEAMLTNQIPDEYQGQKNQYFCVNDKLQKLDFVFYDPRLCRDFFTITVKREEVQDEIDFYIEYQKNILAEIKKIVTDLTF